ncbi:DUF4136 domain-containing protein [Pontibacter actiniarum]|uniref:DUF4136 domain-containing protein n=2 Tax=Pontibacter actiniarum TaxID=323450 RepID=A0A1X9YSR3_9BACT|nr:DUF4136 domain-containing protein [Pontibacter actiniarum]ARS35864.1 hypothetical protein CA264_10680 [Pontibacter actiniarum]
MTKLCFLLCLLLAVVASCSPTRVLETDAAPGFHLSEYKTFDFYDIDASGDALQPYSEQLEFLKQEITQRLEQRGLSRSSSNPDLKINLGVVVAEKVQTRETSILTDPPYYMGQRRYSWQTREVEVGRYQQGTLSMHLVDNAQNELVWQGAAEGVLPDDNSAKVRKRISEGVQKLVEELPQ